MLKDHRELQLCMEDTEWPKEYIDHDRAIARAIVFDDEGYFYFLRVERDDDFGKGVFIETAGGGVEAGEDLQEAIVRELWEELYALTQKHEVIFHKVAGHADNELNNRCDELARAAIVTLRNSLSPEELDLLEKKTDVLNENN